MNDHARIELEQLVKRHGIAIISEEGRCRALLLDYCGEFRREYTALLGALQEGVPASLLASSAIPREVLILNLTRRLEDNLNLTKEAASWAVKAWAEALGPTSDVLLPPRNLTAKAVRGGIQLTWEVPGTATEYNIKRGEGSEGPFALIAKSKTAIFLDSGVKPQATYRYVVSSVSLAKESADSNEAEACLAEIKEKKKPGKRLIYAVPAVLGVALIGWFAMRGSRIQDVQFFESTANASSQEAKTAEVREYKSHFRRDQTRFVNFSLRLKRPVKSAQTLQVTWRRPGKQETSANSIIQRGSYGLDAGIGASEWGTLAEGQYDVEFIIDGQKAAAGGFIIDPPPALEVTSAYSYPSALDFPKGSRTHPFVNPVFTRAGPNSNHFFRPTLVYVSFDISFSRPALDPIPIQTVCHMPDNTTQSHIDTLGMGANSLQANSCGYFWDGTWSLGKATMEVIAGGRKLLSVDFFVEPGTYVPSLRAYAGPIEFRQKRGPSAAEGDADNSFPENNFMNCMVAHLPLAYTSDAGSLPGKVAILSVWYRDPSKPLGYSGKGESEEIHRDTFNAEYQRSDAGQVRVAKVDYCPISGPWTTGNYKVLLSTNDQQISSGEFTISPWNTRPEPRLGLRNFTR
jgi:hypothetical protein